MAKTQQDALQSMIGNLKANTGRPLDEWMKITRKAGFEKHGQLVTWLKKEHGVTHGYANFLAHQTLQSDAASATAQNVDVVAEQYAGAKESLRPIYDKLATKVLQFGKDVEVAPKKSYVSLRRKKQFALLQPSTSSRVDVGLNLKGVKPAGRLEASGSFNSMVTHRVRVESATQVDAELIGWLRQAYDLA